MMNADNESASVMAMDNGKEDPRLSFNSFPIRFFIPMHLTSSILQIFRSPVRAG